MLPLEEYERYEELTEDFQFSFLELPIEFLESVDNSIYSGKLQPGVSSYSPKPFSREWELFQMVVKLLTYIVLEVGEECPHLVANIRNVMDVLAPKAAFISSN